MVKIKIDKISKAYGEQVVLDKVSFDINENEVVGIVGNNGSGKTTLVNIIFGSESFDSGNIKHHYAQSEFGYLKQRLNSDENNLNELLDTTVEHNKLLKATSELGVKNLMQRENAMSTNISGGETSKLLLSSIWSKKHNVLILDEPTNHMDTSGVSWLVEKIKNFRGVVLVISHNRHFLDLVATSIVEIANGKAIKYDGNYTDYKREKEHSYQTALHKYENQRKVEQQIDDKISLLRKWSEKGHRDSKTAGLEMGVKFGLKEKNRVRVKKRDKQVKSKIKQLEKLKNNDVKKPKEEESLSLQFGSNLTRVNKCQVIISGCDLCKKYGDKTIFSNSDFYIKRFDKIGFIGANGTGKTTIIKMILGLEKATTGDFFVSDKIKVGYLSQSIEETDSDITVLERLKRFDREKQTFARIALANIDLKAKRSSKKNKQFKFRSTNESEIDILSVR